jgi:transketolase
MIASEAAQASPATVYSYTAPHTSAMVADLSRRAYEYRAQVLEMVYGSKSGHIGGAFSIAEVLACLYFHQMKLDPANPSWNDRDRLVFSKGHACAMLYTCLANRGFFPIAELPTFRKLNSHLQGHPEPKKTPGVEVAAGPLGHGVAIATGMALAARMEGSKRKVYTILGDGELNSGVIWEGLMVAAKFALDNLTVIVDYNGVQQTGTTSHVMPTEPIAEKLASFNWHVIEIHGHNVQEILSALDHADEVHGRPKVIIARTTKGKGVSFMEGQPAWHGGIPDDQQFQSAMAELEERIGEWTA